METPIYTEYDIYKFDGLYKGRPQARSIGGYRNRPTSIDIHSYTEMGTIVEGDYFYGERKTITPKNGGASFEVITIKKVFLPSTDKNFISLDSSDGTIKYSIEYLDLNVEHYRKGGVKEFSFGGIKTKEVIEPLLGFDTTNLVGCDSTSVIETAISEYKKSHDKFSDIYLSVKSFDNENICVNATKTHYLNGDVETREEILIPVSFIEKLTVSSNYSNICVFFKSTLKDFLNTDKVSSYVTIYSVVETNLDWLQIYTTTENKITNTTYKTLCGVKLEYNVLKDFISYHIKSDVFMINDGSQNDFCYYTNSTWSSEKKELTTDISNLFEIVLENYFELDFDYNNHFLVQEIAKQDRECGLLIAMGLLSGDRNDKVSHMGYFVRDVYSMIGEKFETNNFNYVLPLELQLLQIMVTEKHLPEITTHNFNPCLKPYITKDLNTLTVHEVTMKGNGYLSDEEFQIAFDLPTNTSADYGSDWVTFEFFPTPTDVEVNPFCMKFYKHRGSSSEYTRWGKIEGSSRINESVIEDSYLKHLGVENHEELELKFNELYSKLNSIWQQMPLRSDVAMFNNITNHYCTQYGLLVNEIQDLMNQYKCESKKSTGSGWGFWIPD